VFVFLVRIIVELALYDNVTALVKILADNFGSLSKRNATNEITALVLAKTITVCKVKLANALAVLGSFQFNVLANLAYNRSR
jgi:hypothetical protein